MTEFQSHNHSISDSTNWITEAVHSSINKMIRKLLIRDNTKPT